MTQASNAPKELSCPVMTIYPVKRGSGEAYPEIRRSSVPQSDRKPPPGFVTGFRGYNSSYKRGLSLMPARQLTSVYPHGLLGVLPRRNTSP